MRPVTRLQAFRGCFICVIMATRKFFPLWALARYRNLEKHQQQGGRGRDVTFGGGAAAIVD